MWDLFLRPIKQGHCRMYHTQNDSRNEREEQETVMAASQEYLRTFSSSSSSLSPAAVEQGGTEQLLCMNREEDGNAGDGSGAYGMKLTADRT